MVDSFGIQRFILRHLNKHVSTESIAYNFIGRRIFKLGKASRSTSEIGFPDFFKAFKTSHKAMLIA